MNEIYKTIVQIYLNDLKKNQEPSNILEDEVPSDSIKRTLQCLGNSIGKIQETQENPHGDSTKEFISCRDSPLFSPPCPSMVFQNTEKGRDTQRRR
jgi:hypothetical protein